MVLEVPNGAGGTYDLALVFLLLRFRRLTRFFLHFALILAVAESVLVSARQMVL